MIQRVEPGSPKQWINAPDPQLPMKAIGVEDVVAAAVEDDHARVVGQRDAIHVTEHFRGLRTAEAAVDERIGREVAGGGLPSRIRG